MHFREVSFSSDKAALLAAQLDWIRSKPLLGVLTEGGYPIYDLEARPHLKAAQRAFGMPLWREPTIDALMLAANDHLREARCREYVAYANKLVELDKRKVTVVAEKDGKLYVVNPREGQSELTGAIWRFLDRISSAGPALVTCLNYSQLEELHRRHAELRQAENDMRVVEDVKAAVHLAENAAWTIRFAKGDSPDVAAVSSLLAGMMMLGDLAYHVDPLLRQYGWDAWRALWPSK